MVEGEVGAVGAARFEGAGYYPARRADRQEARLFYFASAQDTAHAGRIVTQVEQLARH